MTSYTGTYCNDREYRCPFLLCPGHRWHSAGFLLYTDELVRSVSYILKEVVLIYLQVLWLHYYYFLI